MYLMTIWLLRKFIGTTIQLAYRMSTFILSRDVRKIKSHTLTYQCLNVGLDNIKLKLAPEDNNTPFVAIIHTVGDLANGVAIIIGGCILDYLDVLKKDPEHALVFYAQIFVLGWIARLLVTPLLAWIIEPGAKRLREIV